MGNVKKDANKREKKLAEELGMRKTLNSGAVFGDGDVIDDVFMIDEKFSYTKKQMTVKHSDIIKLDNQAFDSVPCRIPVLILNFNGDRRALISLDDFNEYRKLLTE